MSQNVLVVHGGGPTAVINASLYGVIEEAKRNPEVGKVYGAIGGTGAIFSETFIDLTSFDDEKLKLLLHTPASAIGSSRYPLYEKDYEKMVDIFKKHDIKYVLLNGGNGTMDACGHIYEVCKDQDIKVVGIPKTIDNDIAMTDHSPGYGSAARFIAASTQEVGEDVKSLPEGASILLDPQRVNYALYRNIPKAVRIVKEENPEVLMKCVKNAAEIENIRRGHIKDGVAHTKFMYWLKKHAGKETITELSASEKLENFRKEQEGYLWPSFDPICAYGQHAAIVHYSSTPETNVELKEGGLFLTDTGGNYYDGSTDITRTVAIGEVDEKQKEDFTMVACSMLRLADAKFLAGCSGMVLDYAAREPFWRRNLNYNHGTGHGVGYLGNIHEAPIGFRWKVKEACAMAEPLCQGI